MYAILRQGSHQYMVKPGDRIQIELVTADVGSTVELDDVLALNAGGKLHVGAPRVTGAVVLAKVMRHAKGPKIRVFKYKRRKGYEKRIGHRQPFTEIQINSLSLNGEAVS